MPLLFFERMTTLMVSMVAQMAAIAMAGFMKRMSDFPPPMSYRRRSRNFLAEAAPAGATVL
jgi:hypothetical protein